MGYKRIPWSAGVMASHPNWYNYLLCQFFCGTLSICIYHPISKAQSTVSVYSCQDPFVAPQGYQHQCHLPAVFREQTLPTGESATWPPVASVSSAGRHSRSSWRSEPQGVQQEGQVCTAAVPPDPLKHAPRGHLKQAHRDICLLTPIAFRAWRGSSDGQHVRLMQPSTSPGFPQAVCASLSWARTPLLLRLTIGQATGHGP